jgi:ATP-binding cassette, subfamily B, bacterial CvaB/MchF/RaxB
MSAVGDFLNFSGRARLPVILQTEIAECGLACLAMVAAFYGREFDLNTLRRRFPISAKGVTLKALIEVASRLGFSSRPLRLEPEHLKELRLPAILHWDLNHFVVLKSVARSKVTIHDPAIGLRSYSFDELSKHMTGVALELTPTPKFERKREVERIRMGVLIGRVAELGRALGQALVLSVIVQLFVLVSPFYMQLAVDDAVGKGDSGLLIALAIGFGLFTLINVAATALRSFVSLQLGNVITFQMVVGLFHHLMRLPLPYFERRHIGDLISRFSATQPIKDLITEGLVAVLVDGVMAIATLALMIAYSWLLALVSLAAIIVYVTLRLAAIGALRRRTEDQIQARARQDSTFIETVRAVQTIKLFGREAEREGVWQNRYAGFVNSGIKLGRLQISFHAANDLIFGIENVAAIYLGARLAIDGALTVGMLFAYMSYKQQFLDKVARLIEKMIDLRMLDLYLERLGDIALAERERGLDAPSHSARPLIGAIEVRNVSFRYSETEPYVLESATLRIEAGELSGSIQENISFFDTVVDPAWVQRCAEAAGIHNDIMRMPMGYHTLVGDMGGAMSGGQRQRILLARALYRKPRILFLDEGTSHLDPAMEEQVNIAIAKLAITRVTIAHRPQTVAAADRILVVHQGRVSEVTRPTALVTSIAQPRLSAVLPEL